jgi:membrane associated rhomboid family serine protease
MLYKLLLALVVTVSLAGGMFPFLLEPPLSFATSMFYVSTPLGLFSVALSIFFFGSEAEEKLGKWRFVLLFLLAGAGSVLLQAGGPEGFAAGAADGFLGAVAAVDPYSTAVMRFIPLPAFALALLMIGFNFVALQQFGLAPLLVGLAFGYFSAATAQAARPPRPRQPQYASGRY